MAALRAGLATHNAVKVCVLNGHDAGLSKELLGIVVDELAVDKAVDAVRDDLGHLRLHLILLGRLDLGNLRHRVDAHARAKDLDLVRVHGRVGNEHARVLNALGLPNADLLVEDEALFKIRILRTWRQVNHGQSRTRSGRLGTARRQGPRPITQMQEGNGAAVGQTDGAILA